MYKGKKLIIAKRPWWRHPIFPWGWYSLCMDKLEGGKFEADGHYCDNDGGGGQFAFDDEVPAECDGGIVFKVNGANGVWRKQYKL